MGNQTKKKKEETIHITPPFPATTRTKIAVLQTEVAGVHTAAKDCAKKLLERNGRLESIFQQSEQLQMGVSLATYSSYVLWSYYVFSRKIVNLPYVDKNVTNIVSFLVHLFLQFQVLFLGFRPRIIFFG